MTPDRPADAENPVPAPDPGTLQWFGLTDRGRVRKNNEDSFLCLQFDAQEVHYLGKIGEASTARTDLLFAVSDGMGGAHAGEFASRTAVEKITRLMPRAFKHTAAGLVAGFEDVLGQLFQEIHKSLLYLGSSYPDCAGMGTTLSLCWFTPGWMYFGHIGDSRIYYHSAREGSLKRLTQDDTHVDWLYRQGKLTEWQARQHPGRTSLQKALGAGHQFVDPQVGAVSWEKGDAFLLCTDGLIDGLNDEQLHAFLKTPDPGLDANPARRLVTASLERSGRDNTTALIVEVL